MGLSAENAERLMRAAGFRRDGAASGLPAAPLWRWRGLGRRKKQDAAPEVAAAGHFAALKEWKVAIG